MTQPSELEDPQAIFRNMAKSQKWDLELGFCAISAAEDSVKSIPQLQSALRQITRKIHIPAGADPFEQTARIRYVLFEQCGFEGSVTDYNAFHNSLLSHALTHKRGLPITLSVLTLCIAEKLNVPLEGVKAPGHFLLRKPDANPQFFIDPFHKGQIIRHHELKAQLEKQHGKMDPEALENATETASVKDIFVRINNNLLISYRRVEHHYGVMRCLERLRLLLPDNPQLIRARAQLLTRSGLYDEAIKELEYYVNHFPEAIDIEDALRELSLLKGIN